MENSSFKNRPGFMPRQFSFTSVPSSYSLRSLRRASRLDLEKIWAEQEKQKTAENSETPPTKPTLNKAA